MAALRPADGGADGAALARAEDRRRTLRRFRVELSLVAIGCVLVALLGSHWRWFEPVDRFVYDGLIRFAGLDRRDDIVLVGIDAQSLAFVGRWPWPRAQQAELLSRINAAAPKLVFADIIYTEPGDPAGDAALVEAAKSPVPLALPVLVDAVTQGGMLIEQLPFPALLAETEILGHVHVHFEADGISRGAFLYEGIGAPHWPHLALSLQSHLDETSAPGCDDQPEWSLANERCDYRRIRFAGPPGVFDHVSASDLLQGRVPAELLKDKVVLLGRTDIGAPDAVPVPVSGESRPMAGIEFHANVLNALANDGLINAAQRWSTVLLSLLCVLLALLTLPRLQPKPMLFAAVGFALLPSVLSIVSLLQFNTASDLAAASVAAALVYPLWSWRRNEMGWRFVGEELDRLAKEAFRWSRSRAKVDADVLPDRFEWLMARELADADRPPVPPLADAEAKLVDGILADQQLGQLDLRSTADPFVSRLLRIRNLADEVRVGREVSLAGLDQMPTGLCVFVASGNVLLANATFMRFTRSVSLPDSFFVLDALDNLSGVDWHDTVRRVALGDETIEVEAHGVRRQRLLARLARLDVSGYEQPVCLVTLTDVTDIRLAQERREETLAFVSHDLRSPISSILALVRDPGNDHWPELAARVEAYARRSLQVSEQFVQLSRVENQGQLELYELDLVSVVESAVDQVFETAKASGHEILVHTADVLPADGWISGDGELLERVFVNLLDNAIKYSPEAERIDVYVQPGEDGKLVVVVQDYGFGIPEDEVERIFDPYFRSSSSALSDARGVGLGLRFVRTVVESHDGLVEVDSAVGQGTAFKVVLQGLPEAS